MRYGLTIRESDYRRLRELLFPGDGREAVAFALCGLSRGRDRTRLLVREILELPSFAYTQRNPDQVLWQTRTLLPWLDRLEKECLSLLKCHSHPGGAAVFSPLDDVSDRQLLCACYPWNDGGVHGSVVLDESAAAARVIDQHGGFSPIESILVIGEGIRWASENTHTPIEDSQRRLTQAFGEGTYRALSRLRIGIVGASGTGSLVIEALRRTGVGHLMIVEPDTMEAANLNRVLHSTVEDARCARPKIDIVERAVGETGLNTSITLLPKSLQDPEAIHALASCDVVFGCVDNREARQLLCRLTAYYLVPYIDVGVSISATASGAIENVSASVHYFRPGQSFIARGVFDRETLRAESIARTDPAHYQEQQRQRYVTGVHVDRPAVMPLNMTAAGFAVMELLARVHGFRDTQAEGQFAENLLALDIGMLQPRRDDQVCPSLANVIGRGDIHPLLGMPALSTQEVAA